MKTFRKIKSTRRDRSSVPLEENVSFVDNYRKSIIDSVKQQVHNEDQTKRFNSGVSEHERTRLEDQLSVPHPMSEQINVYFDKLNADLELIKNSQSGSRIEYSQLAEDVKDLSRLTADVIFLDEGLGKLTDTIDKIPASFIDVQSEIDVVRNHIFESESLAEQTNDSQTENVQQLESKIEEFNNILGDITEKTISEETENKTNTDAFRNRISNLETISGATLKVYEERISEMQDKVKTFKEALIKVDESALIREVEQQNLVETTISDLKTQLSTTVDTSITQHKETIDENIVNVRAELLELLEVTDSELESKQNKHTIATAALVGVVTEKYDVISTEMRVIKDDSKESYGVIAEEIEDIKKTQEESLDQQTTKFESAVEALTEHFNNIVTQTNVNITESTTAAIARNYNTLYEFIQKSDAKSPLLESIKQDKELLESSTDLKEEINVLKSRLNVVAMSTGGGTPNDVELNGRLEPYESIRFIPHSKISVDPLKRQLIVDQVDLYSNVTDLQAEVANVTSNVLILQTSNTEIFAEVGNLTSNVIALEEANTVIFGIELANLTSNVLILQTSNTEIFELVANLTSNVLTLETSTANLTSNVLALEEANTLLVSDFINGTTGQFEFRGTPILTGGTGGSGLSIAAGDIRYANLVTFDTANNLLSNNIIALEESNTALITDFANGMNGTFTFRGNTISTGSDIDLLDVRFANLATFDTANNLLSNNIIALEASNTTLVADFANGMNGTFTFRGNTISTGSDIDLLDVRFANLATFDTANNLLSNNIIALEESNTALITDFANGMNGTFTFRGNTISTGSNTDLLDIRYANLATFDTANNLLSNNITALETSNALSFITADNANTRISALESSNTAIFSRELANVTSNVLILQTSNTEIFELVANVTSNVLILQTSNTEIFELVANVTSNVLILEASNTLIYDAVANLALEVLEVSNNKIFAEVANLTSNVLILQTSNTEIFELVSNVTSNVLILQTSNTEIFAEVGNLTSNVIALEESNTAIYTELSRVDFRFNTEEAKVIGLENANTNLANTITLSANGILDVRGETRGFITEDGINTIYGANVQSRIDATELANLAYPADVPATPQVAVITTVDGVIAYQDFAPAANVVTNIVLSSRQVISFKTQTATELVYKALLFRSREDDGSGGITTAFDYNATRANTISLDVASVLNTTVADLATFNALDLTTISF